MATGDLGVWMVGVDGSSWPVDFLSLSVTGSRYVDGAGSITVPASSPVVSMFMGSTVGEEFGQSSLRVFYRDATTPLWSGIMAGARLQAAGDDGEVEILFEEAIGHAIRRRLITKTAQASQTITAGTIAADNIALFLMWDAMGPTPTEPTGYPAAADRDDFGAFTFEVAAAHSPAESSSMPGLEEESGSTLADMIPEFCEQEDLALVLTDNQDQTYDIDVAYPYEAEDVSADVIFSAWLGNLEGFEANVDVKSLANVWSFEGATSASHSYVDNSASVTVWGVYEAHAQKPQASNNSSDLSAAAGWLTDRYGSGTMTYSATLVESTGCQFNVDWGRRSKVRVIDPVYGYDMDQVCVEFELSADDGDYPQLSFVFGTPALNWDKSVGGYVGAPGPRFGGGRWRQKRP